VSEGSRQIFSTRTCVGRGDRRVSPLRTSLGVLLPSRRFSAGGCGQTGPRTTPLQPRRSPAWPPQSERQAPLRTPPSAANPKRYSSRCVRAVHTSALAPTSAPHPDASFSLRPARRRILTTLFLTSRPAFHHLLSVQRHLRLTLAAAVCSAGICPELRQRRLCVEGPSVTAAGVPVGQRPSQPPSSSSSPSDSARSSSLW
jgi:hypothetical protein